MNLNHALSRLEKRLQRLVEDSLDGIFTATDLQKTLSHELLMALQREARPSSDGRVLAPDQFTIFLPPDTAERLSAYHARVEELAIALSEAIEDFARQSGYIFMDKVSIRILTDTSAIAITPARSTPDSQPAILATFKQQETTQTATLAMVAMPEEESATGPGEQASARAFLIVNGVDIFLLPGRQSGGVINIGRLSTNQLMLEDGRVSRTHAQLRVMQGRYMLFDLASTYGTFVNGLRINTHELIAGDVISFGGVPVVFGLEENTNQGQGRPPNA